MHFLATLAGALLTIGASWSLGRFLFRKLPDSVAFGAGAALLSVAVFLLLSLGIAKPAAFVCLGLACLVPLFRHRPAGLSFSLPWPAAIAAAAYGFLYFIHCLTPEIQTDAMHYHLWLATEARASGGFPEFISFYNVMPLGLETLFAFAYSIGRDSAAKFVAFAFTIATCALMLRLAQRLEIPRNTALCAALFYAVTPLLGIVSTSAFNDSAVAYTTLATFYLLLVWWKEQDDSLLIPAGLLAGFCYALKFTGGIVAPLAVAAIVWRRRSGAIPRLLMPAACVALPWPIRAGLLTGNPFAPLMNGLFPNPWFHVETEQKLGLFLRNYGVESPLDVIHSLVFEGYTLHGLLGPGWLLLPVGLLALRKPQGRLLWMAGGLAMIPWFLNIGARFLMPSMPFFALTLMIAVPGVAPYFVAAHALLSWPTAITAYAPPGAWRLKEAPWRVALRLDDPAAYQKKENFDAAIAELVRNHTPAGDRILDLVNSPAAITQRPLFNAWQTAVGERLAAGLQQGISLDPGLSWTASLGGRRVPGVRITLPQDLREPWRIHEVRVGGQPPGKNWSLEADINLWDAPLALDGNLTTAWSTRQPAKAGTYLEIRFPGPLEVGEVEVIGRGSQSLKLNIGGIMADAKRQPALNLRRAAIQAVKREGIRWVLANTGTDALGLIGQDLASQPSDWGLEREADLDHITLYRVRW